VAFEIVLSAQPQARTVTQYARDAGSLRDDRAPPRLRATLRLGRPLQQVNEEHLEPALELAAVALPHLLDLLRQVSDVQLGQPSRAQQRRGLLGPCDEVVVVARRGRRHRVVGLGP
jgi:hypothetical protein